MLYHKEYEKPILLVYVLIFFPKTCTSITSPPPPSLSLPSFNVLAVPGIGLTPTETPDKDHLSRALYQARKSTASVGKFTDKLPREKPAKNVGKKRKVHHYVVIYSFC